MYSAAPPTLLCKASRSSLVHHVTGWMHERGAAGSSAEKTIRCFDQRGGHPARLCAEARRRKSAKKQTRICRGVGNERNWRLSLQAWLCRLEGPRHPPGCCDASTVGFWTFIGLLLCFPCFLSYFSTIEFLQANMQTELSGSSVSQVMRHRLRRSICPFTDHGRRPSSAVHLWMHLRKISSASSVLVRFP